MNIEAAKSKLQQIVDLARLRREGIDPQSVPASAVATPTPDGSLLDRVKELVAQAEAPLDLNPPAPVVEEAPLGYIEVRVLKWRWIDGFPIKDGYESQTRPRTEEDGDAEFVILKTPPPPMPTEEKAEWPKWGETGRVDPRVAARFDRPQRGWSLNRNSGCMRADGSIEP